MATSIKSWVRAARLRTLPLALSSIILGSALAYSTGLFSWSVAILAVVTTLFLQVLSNFANDYGDAVSGVDHEGRIGPSRAIQSGELTKNQVKRAVILFSILSFTSGIWLVLKGTSVMGTNHIFFFILLGIMAILAAIKYTIGKNPYGYLGLGDLFVFIFFGIVGVGGTYYLHTGTLPIEILLPASSVGLFSAGVLNLNNMRDLDEDKKSGKITLAVRLGRNKARVYHNMIILIALISSVVYSFYNFISYYQFLFLITLPLFVVNLSAVNSYEKPIQLDVHLKKLAISTFLFVLTFGLGLILS